MITHNLIWHVLSLHRGCHCWWSLLRYDLFALLNLHLLVDGGLARFHFIVVVNGSACLRELYLLEVLIMNDLSSGLCIDVSIVVSVGHSVIFSASN